MAPQEQEPILPKLITDAEIIIWSKDHVDRPDDQFEAYLTPHAAEDAVMQADIEAVAKLPEVLRQTRLKPTVIDCDFLRDPLTKEDMIKWKHLILTIILPNSNN